MMNGKTTRRNFLQQTGLWAGAFAFGGSFAKRAQAARDKELNIYCWEGYNSDDVLDPFRREFDATVRADLHVLGVEVAALLRIPRAGHAVALGREVEVVDAVALAADPVAAITLDRSAVVEIVRVLAAPLAHVRGRRQEDRSIRVGEIDYLLDGSRGKPRQIAEAFGAISRRR